MSKLLFGSWLLTALFCLPALAQDVTISGRITSSEDGSALPGVSVQLKGTTRGTTSDAEGNYRLNAPTGGRLVFSFIGFASQEVAIGNQSTIAVSLIPDAANLDEVIVTTFGTAKRASFTGSAGTLSPTQIQNRP